MIINDEPIGHYMTIYRPITGFRYIGSVIEKIDWELEINILIVGENNVDRGQYIINKILFWLEECLYDVFCVSVFDNDGLEITTRIDNNVMHCPEEPVENIILQMIYAKLYSIGEDVVFLGDMKLKSNTTNISYTFDGQFVEYSIPKKVSDFIPNLESMYDDPWWFRNDGHTMEFIIPPNGDDIKKQYESISDPLEHFSELVSKRNAPDDGPAEVIDIKKWNPRIV